MGIVDKESYEKLGRVCGCNLESCKYCQCYKQFEGKTEMTNIYSVNKKAACLPPENITVKVKQHNGLALAEQRVALFPLIVAYSSHCLGRVLEPGTKVWVKGEVLVSHAWAKETFEIEKDKKFVLVPEEMIWVVEEVFTEVTQRLGDKVILEPKIVEITKEGNGPMFEALNMMINNSVKDEILKTKAKRDKWHPENVPCSKNMIREEDHGEYSIILRNPKELKELGEKVDLRYWLCYCPMGDNRHDVLGKGNNIEICMVKAEIHHQELIEKNQDVKEIVEKVEEDFIDEVWQKDPGLAWSPGLFVRGAYIRKESYGDYLVQKNIKEKDEMYYLQFRPLGSVSYKELGTYVTIKEVKDFAEKTHKELISKSRIKEEISISQDSTINLPFTYCGS